MRAVEFLAGLCLMACAGAGQAYSPASIDPLLVDGLWHVGPASSPDSCPVRLTISPLIGPDGIVAVTTGKVEADTDCLDRIMPISVWEQVTASLPAVDWTTGTSNVEFWTNGRHFDMSYETNVYFIGSTNGIEGEIMMFRDGFEVPDVRGSILAVERLKIARSKAMRAKEAERPLFIRMAALILAAVALVVAFSCMGSSAIRRLRRSASRPPSK